MEGINSKAVFKTYAESMSFICEKEDEENQVFIYWPYQLLYM